MPRIVRPLVVLLAVVGLSIVVVPAGAAVPVALTWERNFGTYDGTAPYADGSFQGPADVAADKWGNVYVADGWQGPDRVQMFDPDGTFIKKYDNPGTDPGQLSQPRSITTDRWGHIYVTQQGVGSNPRIEVFNPGLYSHFRTIASAPAPAEAVGIAVGLNGTIYDSRAGPMCRCGISSATSSPRSRCPT